MFHYEREPVSPLRRRFIDDLRLRNKSPRTIETYALRVTLFTRRFCRSLDHSTDWPTSYQKVLASAPSWHL